MISILAVMAGAQGWEDIETYGLSKQAWLEEFLLPNGILVPIRFDGCLSALTRKL